MAAGIQGYNAGLPGAGQAVQAAGNAARQCAGRVAGSLENTVLNLERVHLEIEAPALPEIGARIAELGRKYETTVTPAEFEFVQISNYDDEILYGLETEFYELSWDISRLGRMPFNEAWQRLANVLGWNPRNWPQITALERFW